MLKNTRPKFMILTTLFICGLPTMATQAQTITIDNSDPEFSILYGEWSSGSYGQPNGVDYNWATTTDYGTDPAAARWQPTIPQPRAYNLAVWYVQGSNRADNACFTITHADGSTAVTVNQQINGETWFELGTYFFNAGTGGYVTLDNDAHSAVVIADAIRFTPIDATVELTMDAVPTGWGTTTPLLGGPYTYFLNETVPIAAAAGDGYRFDHWAVSAGAPVADPTADVTSVIMDQSKTVTAVFVEENFSAAEFRGFWADAFHVGFKSQSQIDDMILRALEGNYNAIVPEILAFQDTGASGHGAYWDSDIVPLASDISSGFDPLAYLVEQAHAAGLEVHPWLVTFRISSVWPPAGNTIVAAHPEWLMVPRSASGNGPATVSNYYVFDPGSPDVQEYLLSIVRELGTNYEIDGIHWDYIRYTTADAGYPAYDWYTCSGLARFRAIIGYSGTPATDYEPWCDFRRREITELISRAQAEIATIDSNPRQPLRHTAALITWGNAPSNFENTSSWNLFQNWRLWLEKGYLDAGIPMTYYDYDTYPSYYRNWVDQEMAWRYDRHIYVGPGIYLNSFDNSLVEIEYARAAGANGICTYSYAGTNGSRSDWDWYPYVGDSAFSEPVPIPPMTWRDPATALEGNIYGRVTDGLTGEPLDDATIMINGFAVTQTDGNGYYLLTELAADSSGTPFIISAALDGYPAAVRPAVLVERAGYTEANFGLGIWLPGDYDGDGDVDIDDFTHFHEAMTGPDNGPPPAGGDLFDFGNDSDVDLADFQTFQASFGS